ncbi:MAG TPA: FlgD immunoglobulin-like domain containing protein, partial [Bacteroidales bacterium]|nr:FlgD immunoglobulin-like domain containing protein [Bacteroidales bacterium]
KQPGGSTVNYYITAADQSGRHANAPFIGPADPFTFQTIWTNLTPVPDTLWFTTFEDCMSGKIAQLHNYLANPVGLSEVQTWGIHYPWYADSVSAALPAVVAAGDSVAVRVKVMITVNQAIVYVTDSLRVTSDSGTFHVIIMINHDLLGKVADLRSDEKLNIFPNPVRSETSVEFTREKRGMTSLEVFDTRGTRVKTLISGTLEPGKKIVHWNGRSDDGNRLPAGIYFCRLVTDEFTSSTRLILLN